VTLNARQVADDAIDIKVSKGSKGWDGITKGILKARNDQQKAQTNAWTHQPNIPLIIGTFMVAQLGHNLDLNFDPNSGKVGTQNLSLTS
jgi:hypothetical protein